MTIRSEAITAVVLEADSSAAVRFRFLSVDRPFVVVIASAGEAMPIVDGATAGETKTASVLPVVPF